MRYAGGISWPAGLDEQAELERISVALTPKYGSWLAKIPSLEDTTRLAQDVANDLAQHGAIADVVASLQVTDENETGLRSLIPRGKLIRAIAEGFGAAPRTFGGELLAAVEHRRHERWTEQVQHVNWELADQGAEAFGWYAMQELFKGGNGTGLLDGAARGKESKAFADASIQGQLGRAVEAEVAKPFVAVNVDAKKRFTDQVFLWPRVTGPKGDLVDDEMGRVLVVPGWSNIFTQPIINRIEMLSTGVRTDIGVKVFGPDLDTIDGVCKQIEAALKPISGARDAIAAPIMGKGYLQIDIDREAAARYGISIDDVQSEIEVALAGRTVTYTVEKRERFPVRIRYARVNREDEDGIRRLLISPGGSAAASGMAGPGMGGGPATSMAGNSASTEASGQVGHSATPAHAAKGTSPIPLSAVAKVQIVEGPAMIKSENGRLLNYVTLNVRGRDMLGFVEEAQRVVAQKVKLPEGVHIEWSGEFEHQVRAARTLRYVFPAVIVLIFVILYLTYNDLADAALMMLAVPEALAGGAFFMFLFPKIMHGWDAPPMDFSVAVWVGFIACFGMATETGIIMLVYLREAIEKRGGLEKIASLEELRQAVIEGAVHRLRPKLLTEGVAIIAIFPMVFAKGVGGEILAPMALPVLGGLLISDEVVDLFLPVRFYWVRRARWLKLHEKKQSEVESAGPTESTPELATAN